MNNEFAEIQSNYIKELMSKVRKEKGENSPEYNALYYQYKKTENENLITKEENQKHYEASVCDAPESALRLVERLYKRQATIDLTNACSAHCRYCLRQNYAPFNVTDNDISQIVKYLSNDATLKEVLLTGGDPLLAYPVLMRVSAQIISEASNIRIIRIGTRLPVQNPNALSEDVLRFFTENRGKVFFEVALQVNHVVELTSEAKNCIRALQERGVLVYAQNVLLKNVNNTLDAMIDLYDSLRYLHVEAHYLFHPVPIIRTSQFRMPLNAFLDFARKLTASGEIPGRSKPMFSIMTDVGKVTLYEGTILDKDTNGYINIRTAYSFEERKKWNPGFKLPKSASVDANGELIVKYLDGEE